MQKFRTIITTIAFLLALLILVFFAGSALGTKFGFWDWKTGFSLVRGIGPKLLVVTLGLGVLSLLLSLFLKPRQGVGLSLIAVLISLTGMGYGKSIKTKAASLPAIHDITTDTQDVPNFSQAIIDARAAGDEKTNSLDYASEIAPRTKKSLSETQAAAYPDIKPIQTDLPAGEAYARALKAAKKMRWSLVTQNQDAGIIEATAQTFWFGFKDDVVIRIRPSASGSTIDIRSASRVGMSDIGANADRIRKYTKTINTK